MQIIKDENFRLNNSIVTLGKFDGNHIGHKSLFKKAKEIKDASGSLLNTVIFTFDVNPRSVAQEGPSCLLYTNTERLEIEEGEGMDYCFVWPFTGKNMSMEPEDFVQKVLHEQLGTKHIVVGEDFRFGKNRRGDTALLSSLEEKFGFKLHTVSKIKYKGEDVSSSWIKKEILEGNLDSANYMLGRPFAVSAKVVSGKHLGKSLGFPTINFEAPEGKVIPPDGVYATKTTVCGRTYLSMTNIGTRPTFEEGACRNIETNIFDFDEDIYEKTARVEFYKFIRPEIHFSSSEELVAEIDRNRREIRDFFDNPC